MSLMVVPLPVFIVPFTLHFPSQAPARAARAFIHSTLVCVCACAYCMPLVSSKKRERENPCFICGHYHRYDLGEICKICGHKPPGPAAPAACSVGGGYSVGTNPTFVGNAFVDGAMNASQSLGFCPTVPLSSNGNSSGAGGGQLLAAAHEGLPSEVIPSFLYLGSYDHASRSDLLKAMDVHYVLNVRVACLCVFELYRGWE